MSSKDSFVARFFSGDSLDLYPSNTLASFTCEFAQPLELGEGNWSVGVKELYTNPFKIDRIVGKKK